MKFKLVAPFKPAGGQSEAISKLSAGFNKHARQTLLGITGSGKTYVMASMIEKVQKPTLVVAHNKILAAQLYAEFKEFFPENKVEYFISYYDYYQPESYIPTTDTYIEKDSSINEQIERMRMQATASLMSRDDVIIVASISCIYGLGNPDDYRELSLKIEKGAKLTRTELIAALVDMQYERNDVTLESGNFRARGEVIDVFAPYSNTIYRIVLDDDIVESIKEVHPITGAIVSSADALAIFPAKPFAIPKSKHDAAILGIKQELAAWLPELGPLEHERLSRKVKYDLEMIEELGFCSGIENYSRHFDRRAPGEKPFTLLDYFPKDFLLIIDESHQTIPQSRAMYNGDHARKKNLVEYGFRLPCAYDNRPLKFEEFERYFNHVLFVSATPAEYELKSSGQVAQLIIRPTGLLDPEVEVRPIQNQIGDIISEIEKTVKANSRVLVTTLTKKQAEDLTDFLSQKGVKVRYMHSEIESLDRIELIRQLRAGDYDVLVGINLLREGLDLPEVSLICILDADKEGFLRDERSLIQTIGRAARNEHGKVILYADVMTQSIQKAIAKTQYRREQQLAFNKKHNITPMSIQKNIADKRHEIAGTKHLSKEDARKKIIELEAQMRVAAEKLDFEQAIEIRDTIAKMQGGFS